MKSKLVVCLSLIAAASAALSACGKSDQQASLQQPGAAPVQTTGGAGTPALSAVQQEAVAAADTAAIAQPVASVDIPETLPQPADVKFSPDGLANGAFAPEFELARLDRPGKLKLSSLVNPKANGKADGVLLAFMASWCGICRASLPTLKELVDDLGNRFQLVVVSTDEDAAGQKKEAETIQAAGLNVPVVAATPEVIRAYMGGALNVPRYYFVNKMGEVLVQDRGFGDKVRPMLPKQAQFVLKHPEYLPR